MNFLAVAYVLNYLVAFIVCFNLTFPLLLWLLQKVKRFQKSERTVGKERDYAIIITAYEQTILIPQVTKSLLDLNYSKCCIYIVADNCPPSDDLHFDDERVIVLFPPKVLASNIASHFYAIDHFKRGHDVLLIMDSDNIAHAGLIDELNQSFDQGFDAVQGLRAAKNLDSTIACLDAARDIYYHYYDGKLLFRLGSSATLAGSGMAFDVDLYRESLKNVNSTGPGFDKILQAQIVGSGRRIAFNESAIVYDQKTSAADQLVNQRSRWISTWFRYFAFGFALLFKGTHKLNFNQFLFGLVLLRPPLFIFLSLGLLLMLINFLIAPWISVLIMFCFISFVLSFSISLWNSNTDRKIYKALQYIPVFIFYQLISLAKSVLPNKNNVATKHHHQQK